MDKFLFTSDHFIISTGLKFIIENFMPGSIIDQTEDGDSAFEKTKQYHYDLAVPDIELASVGSGHFQIFESSNFQIHYSVLKLFTGFATAAFIAWKLIVINAINSAVNAAITNTHQLILVL